ncbi:uncharacterized protein LOC100883396 isoform X2 [Megachile rotundata]|uniref:uncharacterized protein LOC100883396 isoform X2 n=1 Tax=Megachile rotundata TaxID=143995 RepID=UPI003FD5A7DA
MARNAKKKLAIFAGTSKCLIYAEAKYCASEIPGEVKYYECSRTEYCCGIGCCVSPGLHFHHLWYYWILVIIMFLVCSGGGWWYRYWLQGRYRAAASAIPARTSTPRGQNPLRGPTCQGQRARITYNSARNTVLLHRPQRNGAVPVYNGNATTSSTNYQNVNVVLNDANCPYYQLYGPPPSYETVIAQTRGKISTNPACSPDSTNTQTNTQTNVQSPSVATNSSLPRCFSYACNSSARLNNSLEPDVQYRHGSAVLDNSRQLENPEGVPFARFPQYCLGTDGPLRQNACVPFSYQERPPVFEDSFDRIYQGSSTNYVPYSTDKSSDTSDPENQNYEPNAKKYATVNVDCPAGSSKDIWKGVWKTSDRSIFKVYSRPTSNKSERGPSEKEQSRGQTRESRSETEASFSSAFNTEYSNRTNDSKSTVNSPEDFESEFTKSDRVYGGSLKAIGKNIDKEYSAENALSKILPRSCDGLINTEPTTANVGASRRNATSSEGLSAVNVSPNSFQSNPSNNVILARFDANASSSSTNNVENETSRSRLVNTGTSTNSDLESKHRLDRSKSLD